MVGKKNYCTLIVNTSQYTLEPAWFYKKCREHEMFIFQLEIVLAIRTVISVTELEPSLLTAEPFLSSARHRLAERRLLHCQIMK